jgi:hypothetical protein
MLCAFHGVRYQLDDAVDIQALTTMANYYFALPRISDTIRGRIAYKIAAVSEFIAQHGDHQHSIATATQAWTNGHEVTLPSYYRQVASVITKDGTTMIEECGALQRLVENKLYLVQRQGAFLALET